MIEEVTGLFWWTFENGMEVLKETKETGYFDDSNKLNGFKAYETLIKGEPVRPEHPDECWAITNRYDPRITKENYDGTK